MSSDGYRITPRQERLDWIIRCFNETQVPTYFAPDGQTRAIKDIGFLLDDIRRLEEENKSLRRLIVDLERKVTPGSADGT